MVRVGPSTTTALLALALLSMQTAGFTVNFVNRCTYPVQLFDAKSVAPIAVGGSVARTIAPNSNAHAFRHSTSAQATLAEFSGDGGRAWYDISIIPTGPKSGPDYCPSLQACKDYTGGVGFNIPMQIAPKTPDGDRCRVLTCMADGCSDAYQYPKDDTKTHTCPLNTDFDVTFCPGGSGGVTQAPTPPPTTKAPTPPPTTLAPTPPPTTVTPTPTPTPTPTATESLESGKLSSSSGSSGANLRTGNAGEDRSISDETDESTTTPPTTESTGAEATNAPTASDAGVVQAGGGSSSGVKEVTTRSGASSGNSVGVYLVVIVGAVGAIAATAIIVVRKKKAQLDALDDKTPAATSNNRGMMMTTPAGSCIL